MMRDGPGAAKIQKARLAAGLQGEKAPWPMRGWPKNPFLDGSLVGSASEVKQETANLRRE